MAASFRDNITFGRPFEAEWFHEVKSLLLSAPYATLTPFSRSQVLSACALHEDIEGLPAGYVICKICLYNGHVLKGASWPVITPDKLRVVLPAFIGTLLSLAREA